MAKTATSRKSNLALKQKPPAATRVKPKKPNLALKQKPPAAKRAKTTKAKLQNENQTAPPPKPTLLRIHILHSGPFPSPPASGWITHENVNNNLKLWELCMLHHSRGGPELQHGLTLRQGSRDARVCGMTYWIPAWKINVEPYRLSTHYGLDISECDWKFVGNEAWLYMSYERMAPVLRPMGEIIPLRESEAAVNHILKLAMEGAINANYMTEAWAGSIALDDY